MKAKTLSVLFIAVSSIPRKDPGLSSVVNNICRVESINKFFVQENNLFDVIVITLFERILLGNDSYN